MASGSYEVHVGGVWRTNEMLRRAATQLVNRPFAFSSSLTDKPYHQGQSWHLTGSESLASLAQGGDKGVLFASCEHRHQEA